MSVSITVDPISFKKLDKRFKLLGEHYPKETFRAIVKILFDIKLIAQRKIKKDEHIVTSRLINSIFVKTPSQKFANRPGNKKSYSADGKSFNADLSVGLRGFEGAVGTNVEYADAIENGSAPHDINSAVLIKDVGWRYIKRHPGFSGDSFLKYAAETVNVNKRLQEIPKNANKKIK